MSNKCDKFLYTEKGNIIKEFRNNFSKLRENELNCFMEGKRKFVRIYFPDLIGYNVEKIIDKICMFISKSDKLYYKTTERIKVKNKKNELIFLTSKDNFIYLSFFFNIIKATNNFLNYKNFINYNVGKIYDSLPLYFINNTKDFLKNSIIHDRFKSCYQTAKKFKDVNNFNELYNVIYEEYEPDIEKINRDCIHFKKQIKKDMKKYAENMSKYSFEELNDFVSKDGKKITKWKMKNIPNSVSFYLKYLPEYYDKEYVKKMVIKKLRKQKIKYKL